MTAPHLVIACHECDLLHRLHSLSYGERAKCSRCGAALYARKRDSFQHTILLAVTSLILFALANTFPFMTFELHGRVQQSLLSTGVWEFFERGMWELGLLVLAASIVFPFLKIIGMLYVLVPLEFHYRPWKAALVFRMVEQCSSDLFHSFPDFMRVKRRVGGSQGNDQGDEGINGHTRDKNR